MIIWEPRDPGENPLDYDINWLPRLGADTITGSVWAITAGDGVLTISSSYFTPVRTKVWVSGGTVGVTYTFKNTVTTAAGDTEIETAKLRIRAK